MSENTEKLTSIKDTLKATSLFGGVQVFNILIQIIRSKFIAILLGPSGMGVYNLYSSTINTISTITSLGLTRSAVKNISENESGNKNRLFEVIGVFRKLVWGTGLLGLSVCLFLSPLLSEWTFGNRDYTIGFVILSLSLLFQQLTSGQTTVMQGLRKYRYMAKANVIGNTIGLLFTVPLLYYYSIDAIVVVLLLSSIFALTISLKYYKKIEVKSVTVPQKVYISEGKNMISMGVALSITSMFGVTASYLLRIFIERQGGLADVGLFAAGYAIVSTYVGMVMNAMTTDYYPRLCAVNKNVDSLNEVINNQMEIGFIILAPLIVAFIVFIKLIVIILYSDQFLPVEGMMYWAMFSTYFQMFAVCLSHVFLAKGDSKLFITNEMVSNAYTIPFQFFGYYLGGLTGLGIAFVFNFILYAIQVFIICMKRYKVTIKKRTFILFFKQVPIIGCCLLLVIFANAFIKYTIGGILVITSLFIAYIELDKRIEVNKLIKRLIKKHE